MLALPPGFVDDKASSSLCSAGDTGPFQDGTHLLSAIRCYWLNPSKSARRSMKPHKQYPHWRSPLLTEAHITWERIPQSSVVQQHAALLAAPKGQAAHAHNPGCGSWKTFACYRTKTWDRQSTFHKLWISLPGKHHQKTFSSVLKVLGNFSKFMWQYLVDLYEGQTHLFCLKATIYSRDPTVYGNCSSRVLNCHPNLRNSSS